MCSAREFTNRERSKKVGDHEKHSEHSKGESFVLINFSPLTVYELGIESGDREAR